MHYLLFYDVTPDYVERRAAFRAEHLGLAWAAQERGELILGGALAEPVDGTVLLFRGDSPAVAEDFARADPYVLNGLVREWRVRPWTTVVGDDAATPVRPDK
ncbi:MAG TPA: YciI-like protein [Longimicrobiales bacterium]|nr:YciI-like protein [Longimicrobiales bacterium]